MGLRQRRPDDVPTLGAILAETRRNDGYPPHWPAGAEFLVPTSDELDAVVHEDGAGTAVGHVALHQRSARAVMEVAVNATGLEIEQLAVVARLFVRSSARQRGVGRALLEHASARAHQLRRRPMLDVWEGLGAARTLYGSAGWELAGSVTIEFRSACTNDCVHAGTSINSLVFIGPPAGATRLV